MINCAVLPFRMSDPDLVLGANHQTAGPGVEIVFSEQHLNVPVQRQASWFAQPDDEQAVMTSRWVLSMIGEVEVLRDQKSVVALSAGPDLVVRVPTQAFVINGVRIMPVRFEGGQDRMRDIFVDLDLHAACDAGTGKSSAAAAAANATTALTAASLKDGKS